MKKIFQSFIFTPPLAANRVFEPAYALFRFYCGISIALGAGLPKIFHKIDETGGTEWDNLAFGASGWFVEQVGNIGFTFPSPTFWVYLAIYGEFIGGLFVAIGLFTRIAALQMTFQFFVVSFLWYESPVPFAMYYQQLIFWTFILISAVGGGKYSIDWLIHQKRRVDAPKTKLAVSLLFLLMPLFGAAQTSERASFIISNLTLGKASIDIRSFDYKDRKTSGYGYDLGPLSSHGVNMPAGTRIYKKQKKAWVLFAVVTPADNGRTFNLNQTVEIAREQYLQAAYDEQNEETARLEKISEEPDAFDGPELVTFMVSGKSLLPKQVYVRVQLPDTSLKSTIGFSRKLDRSSKFQVSYPVGSKVYLCEGDCWNGDVEETLVLILDAEKQN